MGKYQCQNRNSHLHNRSMTLLNSPIKCSFPFLPYHVYICILFKQCLYDCFMASSCCLNKVGITVSILQQKLEIFMNVVLFKILGLILKR